MKVLLINGSPHEKGCTFTALTEVANELNKNKIDTEIIWLGNGNMHDCMVCCSCQKTGKCVFNDDVVNEIIEKAEHTDGFIFGSPVYYAHPSGRILSALDRIFMAGNRNFAQKPAASIVSARRAGTTASLDVLNKHITFAQMPLISSTYWSMVHGSKPDDVAQDLEGLQTMRNIGKNMAWILNCIEQGKKAGIYAPIAERENKTNFIK